MRRVACEAVGAEGRSRRSAPARFRPSLWTLLQEAGWQACPSQTTRGREIGCMDGKCARHESLCNTKARALSCIMLHLSHIDATARAFTFFPTSAKSMVITVAVLSCVAAPAPPAVAPCSCMHAMDALTHSATTGLHVRLPVCLRGDPRTGAQTARVQ